MRILRENGAGDGGGVIETIDATSWRDSIPEDIRGHDALKDISGATANDAIGQMARMTINAQTLVGRDKVILPGPNATPEDLRTFYTGIGCPSESKDYELPGELPESYKIDEKATTAFFKEAHDMGLTKPQAARLIRMDAARFKQAAETAETARTSSIQESEVALRTKWGNAYDERLAFARDAVERFGGRELKELLDATGLGNNHLLCIAFAEMGKMVKEDEILGGGSGARFKMTPDEAKATISQKELDKEFMKAYTSEYHPSHKAAMDEMQKLYEIAHPQQEPESIAQPLT